MNVKIFSEMSGEITFDMSEASFMQIIGAATMYAKNHVEKREKVSAAYDEALKGIKEYAAKQPEVKPEKPVSKVERMFGDVRSRIPVAAVTKPLKNQDEGYKGFLLIECKGCGNVRGFYAKYPQSVYHCQCGCKTKLEGLRPMFPKCAKCGNTFKYMTNITKPDYTYNCLDCGSPIDMVLNKNGSAYVVWR
jgi:ribosomal protein S27E